MKAADKILIIDDEKDICFLLAGMLKNLGYKPFYVHSLMEGASFLATAEEQPFLLFLDVNLPDGSGLERIPAIKSLYPMMKIILISAYSDLSTLAEKQFGADLFLSKPFRLEDLKKALQKIKDNTIA